MPIATSKLGCLTLAFLLGPALQGSGPMQPEPESERLSGNVRSAHIEKAKFAEESGRWREQPRVPWKKFIFDDNGNPIEELSYGNRVQPEPTVYKRDARGNITETTEYDEKGSRTTRYDFAYDARGLMTHWRAYNSDGSVRDKLVYSYDSESRQTEQRCYRGEDQLVTRDVRSYDTEGRLQEVVSYAGGLPGSLAIHSQDTYISTGRTIAPGFPFSRNLFSYDPSGRLREIASYGPDGERVQKIVFTWQDRPQKWTEHMRYNPDGSVTDGERRQVDEVDSFGNATQKTLSKWDKTSQAFIPSEVIYTSYTYY